MERLILKKTALCIAIAASFAAAPALAQSWYMGAGIGRGNLNMSGTELTGLNNAQIDDSDTTYTLRGGYRFNPYFALELGYYDLGQYTFSGTSGAVAVSGSAKAKSYGLSAVGILPLGPQFDLYGRLGYAESELKANANTTLVTANSSDRQGEATYGFGARWNANKSWGLFAEWMKNDKIKVDSYMAGVDFRF
jgi:OOP family OmpA-OmpF porin